MSFPCAILCHSVFKTAPRALLFVLLTTGCGGETGTNGVTGFGGTPGAAGTGGSAPIDGTSHQGGTAGTGGVVGTGGAVITGGTVGTGGMVGTGGTSGMFGTSGTAGTGGINDCYALRSPPNCGTCTLTLQEYCGTTISCQLNPASICTQFAFGSTWKRGCGYLRQDSQGDVGDLFTSIWDEASGQLVYYWFNGKMSMSSDCVPERHAGTEPTCDVWTDACGASGGTGGTSGSGGSASIIQTGGAAPTGGNSAVGSGGSPANTGGAAPTGGNSAVGSGGSPVNTGGARPAL